MMSDCLCLPVLLEAGRESETVDGEMRPDGIICIIISYWTGVSRVLQQRRMSARCTQAKQTHECVWLGQ